MPPLGGQFEPPFNMQSSLWGGFRVVGVVVVVVVGGTVVGIVVVVGDGIVVVEDGIVVGGVVVDVVGGVSFHGLLHIPSTPRSS